MSEGTEYLPPAVFSSGGARAAAEKAIRPSICVPSVTYRGWWCGRWVGGVQ